MDFQKLSSAGVSPVIQDYELQAIAGANTPGGMTWKKVLGDATGRKMWKRIDGTILWLRSSLVVRLELPTAREQEAQLKIEKEQKARASVPHF